MVSVFAVADDPAFQSKAYSVIFFTRTSASNINHCTLQLTFFRISFGLKLIDSTVFLLCIIYRRYLTTCSHLGLARVPQSAQCQFCQLFCKAPLPSSILTTCLYVLVTVREYGLLLTEGQPFCDWKLFCEGLASIKRNKNSSFRVQEYSWSTAGP